MMKVKNPWVTSVRNRALNEKLKALVSPYVGLEYNDKIKTEILTTVKKFISRENLADDTAFVIHLEKRPGAGISGIYHTSHFKGISIVA